MKLDLLTNAIVVGDAIRFVKQRQQSKAKLKMSSNEGNNKASKEPDYNNNNEDTKGEEKQEERKREKRSQQQIRLFERCKE
jgi:hypothetical protein